MSFFCGNVFGATQNELFVILYFMVLELRSFKSLVLSSIYTFLLCLLFLFSGLLACSETKQEILARLARTIAENTENKGQSKEIDAAREEIAQRFIEENRKHSVQLAESEPNRLIKISLDGSTLIWVQEGYLYYVQNERQWKLGLDLEGDLLDMNPSWNGDYLVLFVRPELGKKKKNRKCQPKILSLVKRKFLEYDLPKLKCSNTPAINDKGNTLFYAAKGELRRFPLDNLSFQQALSQSITFSAKHFTKKYKKVKNRFVLYQAAPQAVLIFFGNVGYYNMYYYNGQTEDKLDKSNIVFSSARLYPSFRLGLQNKMNVGMQTQEKKRLGLYEARAFAYSGGAGKRKLHALHFGEELKVGEGFQAQVFSQLIFLQEQGQFLSIQEQKLYFWDPVSVQRQRLPLSAKNLFLFRKGLIYVDLLGQLYLRQSLFSDFEMSLLDLYDEISSRELSPNAAFQAYPETVPEP